MAALPTTTERECGKLLRTRAALTRRSLLLQLFKLGVVSDWAHLPPNVCQQILSVDADSHVKGSRVCKTWQDIQQASKSMTVQLCKGTGIGFDTPSYATMFCRTAKICSLKKRLQQMKTRDTGRLIIDLLKPPEACMSKHHPKLNTP